jgi:hypothetical protein
MCRDGKLNIHLIVPLESLLYIIHGVTIGCLGSWLRVILFLGCIYDGGGPVRRSMC